VGSLFIFAKEVEFLAHLQRRWSAFEKIKCIFFIALVGNLEKSRECFSLTGRNVWRHRTQGVPCSYVRCGLSLAEGV